MLVAIVTAAFLARAGHDFRLTLVVLRVQHLVLDPASLERLAQRLGNVHAHRADQDRESHAVQALDLGANGVVLLLPALVDPVGHGHAVEIGRCVGMTLTSSP